MAATMNNRKDIREGRALPFDFAQDTPSESRGGRRSFLWKAAKRQEKVESGAAERVLGRGNGRVRIARAALGVNHLDVGRGAGAETDVDDIHHLLSLVGGRLRAGE